MIERPPMTNEQFRDTIARLGMTPNSVGRLWGVNRKRVQRWWQNEEDIPTWVDALLHLTEALVIAKRALHKCELTGEPPPFAPLLALLEAALENATGHTYPPKEKQN